MMKANVGRCCSPNPYHDLRPDPVRTVTFFRLYGPHKKGRAGRCVWLFSCAGALAVAAAGGHGCRRRRLRSASRRGGVAASLRRAAVQLFMTVWLWRGRRGCAVAVAVGAGAAGGGCASVVAAVAARL